MIHRLSPDLIQIRSFAVSSYLLREGERVWLIDGGFIGALSLLEEALTSFDLSWKNIEAVLMTHGHLDHTLNLAEIVRRSACWIYGHPADQSHFRGEYRYQGTSRICGGLESFGRALLSFESREPSHELCDGQIFDFWGGLEVIHLPGHTAGHCGFYSPSRKLLFSGDLFESYRFRTAAPWPFLNTCSEELPSSFQRVRELQPDGILSNHCDRASAEEQKKRFFKKRFL